MVLLHGPRLLALGLQGFTSLVRSTGCFGLRAYGRKAFRDLPHASEARGGLPCFALQPYSLKARGFAACLHRAGAYPALHVSGFGHGGSRARMAARGARRVVPLDPVAGRLDGG